MIRVALALITATLPVLFAPAAAVAQTAPAQSGAALDPPKSSDDGKLPVSPDLQNESVAIETSAAFPVRRRTPLAAFWDHGLRIESENDQFRLHLGGSAQLDSTWFIGPQSVFLRPDGSANGVNNSDATFLRRVRLRADGELYDSFDFVVEYDLASASNENSGNEPLAFSSLIGTPSPASVWIQMRDLPLAGNVRLGYQLKPIGMTNNTAQTNLPFLERPDNSDSFYAPFDNGFTLGISARNWIESERLAWTMGVYRPSTNVFGVTLNKYAYGARLTGTPVYEDEGQYLVHLGVGFFGSQLPEDQLRVRARPVLRNGPGFAVPVMVDTGQIPGDFQHTIGPEFALVYGSLTVQAEWAAQFLTDAVANRVAQNTVCFHGGYVEALWFLTGEHQAYDKRDGVFGRVTPSNDYYFKKGEGFHSLGAFQIGVRFSYVDLNDKAIQGGRIYDWTFGLNWYLNPNIKVQANYIVEHRDGPTGSPVGWINGVGLRTGFDF